MAPDLSKATKKKIASKTMEIGVNVSSSPAMTAALRSENS
jgi:hypothetical protein